ncbi:hypothetical protein [Bacillus nitratireducens]|uniref:hypothetical protein n=1 Tax=Bacillus nitratireducens TaxID=2026193 RepID=UPI002E202947|nr:hypothetical protein [Bacillus nitratireducens]
MILLEGIFCNYVRAFPLEMERMFKAVKYLVEQGIGGDVLELISRKSFRDTNEQYLSRLQKEALAREDGLHILCRALLKWYDSWKGSFENFDVKNARTKYDEQPLHTWLHCLLTGKQHIYQDLIKEELVVIENSKWNEMKRNVNQAEKSLKHLEKEEKIQYQKEKSQRLLKLYEKDEEVQIKEMLLDKKIAVFLESRWTDEQIEELKAKYHFCNIEQFSSIVPTSDIGNFDYYLFLTSQAAHSAKYALDSKISRDKLFLISYINKERVIEEWLKQLKGKRLNYGNNIC